MTDSQATVQGRRVDARLAPTMLRLHSVLLGSKRRLLRHCLRIAASASAKPRLRERAAARAARVERDISGLQESRVQWALLAPPSYPDYWVASYESLVTLTEELLSEMCSELPHLSEGTRHELLTQDIPELRRQLLKYRSELRRWTKATFRTALKQGEADDPTTERQLILEVLDGLRTATDA